MKRYFRIWAKIFNFKDRAARADIWIFSIFNIILMFGAAFLFYYFFQDKLNIDPENFKESSKFSLYLNIIFLPATIANISLTVRRFHDLNQSGFRILLALIPIIGSLYVGIVTAFYKGTPGRNKYGAQPLPY